MWLWASTLPTCVRNEADRNLTEELLFTAGCVKPYFVQKSRDWREVGTWQSRFR